MSNDKNYIFSGSDDKTIRIWSLLNNELIKILEGHNDSILCLTISSDDNFLFSGSKDKTIRIWNLLEKKQISVLEGHRNYVWCLVISNDSKYLISVLVIKQFEFGIFQKNFKKLF